MDHLKVAIGSDHGGFNYKQKIIEYLKSRNIEYVDVGTYTREACDYPDIARNVTELVASGQADRGILVCGTHRHVNYGKQNPRNTCGALR